MSWPSAQTSYASRTAPASGKGNSRGEWIPASRQPSVAPSSSGPSPDGHAPSTTSSAGAGSKVTSWGAAPAPRPSACGPSGTGSGTGPSQVTLTCTGCTNPKVSDIIKGAFTESGSNHGKPVYKKEGGQRNVTILIYFWDDRDGPMFTGWWFGPKVGGDQVWAFNSEASSPVPPASGWKVPYDGPVDNTLQLVSGTSPASRGVGVVPPQRPQQQPQDDWRRQEAEKQREEKRREEERRQREEEARKKRMEQEEEERKVRQEEEQRRKEQAAALAVRKVIQRVRTAQPETYDALRVELEEAQAQHLEAMGSQAEKVSQEAVKAMQQAQQRIDELNEKRAEDERRAAEEEKRLKEEAEKVERLMKEIKAEVVVAEKKVEAATESAKLVTDSVQAEPGVALDAADVADKVIQEAKECVDTTSKLLSSKRDEMGDCEATRNIGRELTEAKDALSNGLNVLAKLTDSVSSIRDREARKCAALKKQAERKEEFNKFDTDKDGSLNASEIIAFSKSEYDFELAKATLDKILKFMAPVSAEKLQRLRGMVAIARSEAVARATRAAEEEKKREEEEARKAMRGVFDEIAELLNAAEEIVTSAETDGKPLNRSCDLDAEEMRKAARTVEEGASKAEGELEKAMARLTEAESTCAAQDALKSFETKDIPKLKLRHGKAQTRCEKASELAKQAKEKAVRKAYAEIEQQRAEVVTAIRSHMTAESKSGPEVFAVASDGEEMLSRKKFAAFIEQLGADIKLDEDQVNKLFDHIAINAAEVSKDQFLELIRLYYKCVKPTVITETISIKSKTIRRLDLAEVVEALEGPCKDDGASVERVRCKAVNDDVSGWVTIAGNQGTSFLEPGGNLYAVLKETVLSDGLSVQDSKTLRRVSKGEVIEVVEFAKKDESLGVKRVRAKCKLDGAMGWVTMSGNQGTCYLEQC
eukprot:TRINITY_DN3053_c0_g1_i1.p1 TRINITY_DN3053_c0_g1~~TRINITY_DN3053_c0_g1_i1.p1  ORF type:complete len:928 (-),score=242.72 TRINITY_DN3053_c0_g1_i1:226-3009(-)